MSPYEPFCQLKKLSVFSLSCFIFASTHSPALLNYYYYLQGFCGVCERDKLRTLKCTNLSCTIFTHKYTLVPPTPWSAGDLYLLLWVLEGLQVLTWRRGKFSLCLVLRPGSWVLHMGIKDFRWMSFSFQTNSFLNIILKYRLWNILPSCLFKVQGREDSYHELEETEGRRISKSCFNPQCLRLVRKLEGIKVK